MADELPIYVFRHAGFAPTADTVVAVAPVENVVSKFGAGGHWGEAGLVELFGGAVMFKNDETGACFLGVWGKRKAARFRARLRVGEAVVIIHNSPPGRMVWIGRYFNAG
jgi:hypothetical protein